jgi:hypothetical protein
MAGDSDCSTAAPVRLPHDRDAHPFGIGHLADTKQFVINLTSVDEIRDSSRRLWRFGPHATW